jgi:hypothetical protein
MGRYHQNTVKLTQDIFHWGLQPLVAQTFFDPAAFCIVSLEQRVAHIHGELFETFLKCLAVCIGEKCPAAVGVGSDSNDIIRGN